MSGVSSTTMERIAKALQRIAAAAERMSPPAQIRPTPADLSPDQIKATTTIDRLPAKGAVCVVCGVRLARLRDRRTFHDGRSACFNTQNCVRRGRKAGAA